MAPRSRTSTAARMTPPVDCSDASVLDALEHWPPQRNPVGVLVAVHGVTRQRAQMFELCSSLAEQSGLLLVAPHFSAETYPDYQRLGREGRGARADLALIGLLDQLACNTGGLPVMLMGFSGGAQFAHRFALAHPQRLAGVALLSSGWYTMPDPAIAYPYGLHLGPALTGIRFDLRSFLRLPLLTAVGAKDTQRDASVRSGTRIDRGQGITRLDRAQAWHESLRCCSTQLGMSQRQQLVIVPGVGHDAGHMIASLQDRLRSFLGFCIERHKERYRDCGQ